MDINKVDPGSGDISEDSTEKSRHISRTESHGELLVFITTLFIFYLILLFNLLLKDSSGKLKYPQKRNRIELLLVNI